MPDSTPEPSPHDAFTGSNTLLVGPPGAGKTDSLATLVQAGLELFCVFTEPNAHESLVAGMKRRKLDMSRVHWHYVSPAVPTWDMFIQESETVGRMSYENLSKIKTAANKTEYCQFIDLLNVFANYTDQRTGENFGMVDSWGPDRALAVDSLSGINLMALDLAVGSKPTRHEGEWGVAMNQEERLILKLCADTQCFFVMCAHMEKEPDPINGGVFKTIGALGKKLGPKLGRFFSDVVHVHRMGDKFFWDTESADIDLKFRLLDIDDKLSPSFVQIIKEWNDLQKDEIHA